MCNRVTIELGNPHLGESREHIGNLVGYVRPLQFLRGIELQTCHTSPKHLYDFSGGGGGTRCCNSGGNSSSGTPSSCCCLRAERFSGVKYLIKGGGAGKAEDTREEDPVCSADMDDFVGEL